MFFWFCLGIFFRESGKEKIFFRESGKEKNFFRESGENAVFGGRLILAHSDRRELWV